MSSAGWVVSFGNRFPVKRAFVNVAAGQTDAVVVAAVAGKEIHILSFIVLVGNVATNVTFNSKPAGAGVAISPLFAFGANGGIMPPNNDHGYFNTVEGESLSVTTGAGSSVGILVNYIERK